MDKIKYSFQLIWYRIKLVLFWLGKKKKIIILAIAAFILAISFFIFAWPNLTVSAISVSINEWQVRSIIYYPSGDSVAVIKLGDKVDYSVITAPSPNFVLTECESDNDATELAGSSIIAKQVGRSSIICRSKIKQDITATITIEVIE